MTELDFDALLAVVALGVLAPLVAASLPGPKIPSVVLEICFGILVGPALGLVHEDEPVTVLALVGLAMLLLLALLFSAESASVGAQAILLGSLVGLAAVVGVSAREASRVPRVRATLAALQDTTAQIRVRLSFLLLITFVAAAEKLGLEVILG